MSVSVNGTGGITRDPIEFRQKAEARLSESYVVEQRNQRIEIANARMARLDEIDRLYRGDWKFLSPGEKQVGPDRPKVMNQVQVELDDIARLVSETVPSVRIDPQGESEKANRDAVILESIATGYWTYNNSERLIPITAMDLAGAGCAFWLPYFKAGFDYPALMRLDPRSCYPTLVSGELTDLMHITRMKGRQLKALKGVDLGMPDKDVEVIGFYDELEWGELAYGGSGNTQWIQAPVRHGLVMAGRGIVPVAFAQLDSFDGAIRGMFDQIGGSLEAKNRIANLILDGADQAVYAPIVQFDVENAGDFGPLAIINKNSKEAEYGRAMPAEVSPQLFALMSLLEGETRAGGGYPATRQGEVSAVNPASAAFITSTQGVLTSTIRNIDRLLGLMRQSANRIMFALDEKLLNFEKPLCRTVGGKKTYVPRDSIAGRYDNQVVYGAGAGLDKANQYVLGLQLKGAGVISDETLMGMLSEIPDPVGEVDKIERQQMRQVVLQKFAGEASLDLAMAALLHMEDGDSLPEAVRAVKAQAAAEAQAQQPAQPGAQPGAQPMMPDQVAAQGTSLQQGGVPGEAPAQSGGQAPEFAPPPAESIFVSNH